jgi:hypothetical protein
MQVLRPSTPTSTVLTTENLITLMRIKKIPILMIKKTRRRQKKFIGIQRKTSK